MITTISSKGQIVLPAEIRHQDGIQPGQEFEVERVTEGEYLLKRKSPPRNQGLVALLRDCPVKDWAITNRSEMTDDLRTPRLG